MLRILNSAIFYEKNTYIQFHVHKLICIKTSTYITDNDFRISVTVGFTVTVSVSVRIL